MLEKADPIDTMSPFQHEINPCAEVHVPGRTPPHPLSVVAKIGPRAAEGLVPGTDLLLARGRLPPYRRRRLIGVHLTYRSQRMFSKDRD